MPTRQGQGVGRRSSDGRTAAVNEHDRIRWARALVFAGWMSVLAYLGYLATQIRRAAATRSGSFEDGVWGQRVEFVSFAALPQNVTILMPGVAAAVAAAILVRPLVDQTVLSSRQLVRITAGIGGVIVVIGFAGIIGLFFRNVDPVSDFGALLGRLGGILMAIGSIRLCNEAERTS
jgi:hypothetical protein